MKVYIVTHKVPGYETRVCAAYANFKEAVAEANRLDAESSAATALVHDLELVRPREWTEEQRRWLRGAR